MRVRLEGIISYNGTSYSAGRLNQKPCGKFGHQRE